MKNIISKTTALTLIELIVSSMLVTVVLFGLVSITSVLSTNSQDYGQKYLLASQTQATLNHILGNASLAVRDIASADPGIITSQMGILGDTASMASFCIHQNISPANLPANNTPNNTPGVYTNDRWLCYTLNNYQINYCSKAYAPGSSPWGAVNCGSGTVTNSTFLGTAYSITTPAQSFTNATFSISIENCFNDAAASCYNATASLQDPVNNPQVTRSGSVTAQQVGS
jgi:hypothetical protein